MTEYQPGIGCRCCAHSENECCCPNVDWRSTREVELEALVEKLTTERADAVNSMRVALAVQETLRLKCDAWKHDAIHGGNADYLRAENEKLRNAIERMRVAGGSQEFQMAFELAKDLL